jgi:phosphodiesterase/alkaline phosphatase D-like protein
LPTPGHLSPPHFTFVSSDISRYPRLIAARLDYFVFLGDTIYETASKGSPAAADPFFDPARALADYRRKYLENIWKTFCL